MGCVGGSCSFRNWRGIKCSPGSAVWKIHLSNWRFVVLDPKILHGRVWYSDTGFNFEGHHASFIYLSLWQNSRTERSCRTVVYQDWAPSFDCQMTNITDKFCNSHYNTLTFALCFLSSMQGTRHRGDGEGNNWSVGTNVHIYWAQESLKFCKVLKSESGKSNLSSAIKFCLKRNLPSCKRQFNCPPHLWPHTASLLVGSFQHQMD